MQKIPGDEMTIQLISYTPDPEHVVANAARICYNSNSTDDAKLIRLLINRGHLSPLEHVSFTFELDGVSRALLAQITRHRIASFSVQSQRYVRQDGFDYVIPPAIEELGAKQVERFRTQMKEMDAWYRQWLDELGPEGKEDARFVLPNAAATHMIVTMNARELLHFFELRCCNRAQWEIREVAWEMLRLCRLIAPNIFKKAGPGCINNACPEGDKGCGEPFMSVDNVEAIHRTYSVKNVDRLFTR